MSLNPSNLKYLSPIHHGERIDEQLFLKGEEYDAYSSFVNIFSETNEKLLVVDSYADNTFLDIIRRLKCKVILITKNSDRLSDIEIEKYNKQYHNLKVIRNNDFHDRFIIIDNMKYTF